MLAILFPAIDPVLLSIGPIEIRWYGIAYGVSIVIGYILIQWLNKKDKQIYLSPQVFDDLFLYITLGIVLGGRLGYVIFYHIEYFIHDPLRIVKMWDGGMSFHGGILGVICACWLLCRKHNIPFLYIADMISCVAPIGLFLGRIANFMNAELYGRITNVPWAVIFPGESVARHPSQLYEAFAEGILLFCILFAASLCTKARYRHGMLSGLFLSGYALARFTIEYSREPDAHIGFVILHYTMGQLLTIPMLIAGAALMYCSYNKAVIAKI